MRSTLTFFFLAPFLSHAQNDYLANSPIWTQHSVCNDPNSQCLTTDQFNYVLGGDTIIQGMSYVRVLRSGMESYSWNGPPPFPLPPWVTCSGSMTYPAYELGYIRQEGSRIHTWYWDEDRLLYDFDLEVGDTLPLSVNNWNTDITVTAIDSFLVGTEWRKRFTLNNSWSQFLLEGIGSDHGLFEPISSFFDCGYELTCFGLGSEAFYPEAGPACALITPIANSVHQGARYSVFPNPADHVLTLEIPESLIGAEIRICDSSGRVLLRSRTQNHRVLVDVSTVPNGLYLVLINELAKPLVIAH